MYILLWEFAKGLYCKLKLLLTIDLLQCVKQCQEGSLELLIGVGNPSNVVFGVERAKDMQLTFEEARQKCLFKCKHEVSWHELKACVETHDDI